MDQNCEAIVFREKSATRSYCTEIGCTKAATWHVPATYGRRGVCADHAEELARVYKKSGARVEFRDYRDRESNRGFK